MIIGFGLEKIRRKNYVNPEGYEQLRIMNTERVSMI
jgi:hypothetical protein